MIQIELVPEQLDAIIIQELKSAHEMNMQFDRDEGGTVMEPDWELLGALEQVLAYYMPPKEFERWHTECGLQKLTNISQAYDLY